jgi:uncharacterized protein (DUF305 family)
MNLNTRTLFQVFFICALGAVSQIAQAQSSTLPASPMPPQHMQMHKDMMGSDSMKKSMMTGMDRMNTMTMTGDTDKDFAMMMKIHHQQAVDMSEMQLTHGKSPAMKKIARNIISAQKKEIAFFDQWLAQQK